MKEFKTVIAVIALASTISFSAQAAVSAQSANQSGWATQAGPLVTCTLPDGTSNYVPSMLCKKSGGTYNRD